MEKTNNSPEDLLRIFSHELKSPITSIETILQVITGGYAGKVDPKIQYFLEKAVAKTAKAREIINDIVDYKMFSEKKENIDAEIDVTSILLRLLKNYLSQAADKAIHIHTDLTDDTRVIVNGDEAGLELVFKNLLENSLKFTKPDGTVSVSLAADEDKKTCTVFFKDTGTGIPQDDLPSIWKPFFRSKIHRASTSGTGLGLAIVKEIIENHKGAIEVKSTIGEGTVFFIVFRLVRIEKGCERAEKKKVVIIGGVTAGPKVAARLRRLDEEIDITIIEKSEFLSYAGCGIPYYLAGKLNSPMALMSTADNTIKDISFFETIKNIRIFNRTEAIKIDRNEQTVTIRDTITKKERDISYDILVIAMGARAKVPDIPGIKQSGIYSLYNFEDAEAIKRELLKKRARDVYIIGGGLVGIETAESLISSGARVTVLEKDARILNLFDGDISIKIEQELSRKGIKVITGINIKKITSNDGFLNIHTDRGKLVSDIIILSTGVIPNADLAVKAGLALGKSGGIKVDEHLTTSDKNIYAVGDCAESIHLLTGKDNYLPLGSISTKMGRIAADNISGKNAKYTGNLGTTLFKIFDINVGRTGLSEDESKNNGYDPETIIITGLDRSHYHENANYIMLKLIADKKTKNILGAQSLGKGDIVTRISVAACAITCRMTLDDLFNVDLGYYPAYNNPIDILQTACLLLKGKIEKFYKTITLLEFTNNEKDYEIIDVSPVSDNMFESIPQSISIPLESLRSEKIPFPKDTKILLFSKTSSRAYEAYRYLAAIGFDNCYILEGGLLFWK